MTLIFGPGYSYKTEKGTFWKNELTDSPFYIYKFSDYHILCDFILTDFMKKKCPLNIRDEYVKNWKFVLNVPETVNSIITEKHLFRQTIRGGIIAYCINEYSIKERNVTYYGFVSSFDNEIKKGFHTKEKIFNDKKIWPREIYIKINNNINLPCFCGNDCKLVTLQLRNNTTTSICFQNIPWNKIFLFMGDFKDGEGFQNEIPVLRNCVVCKSCNRCNKNIGFCRFHKVCKHERRQYNINTEGATAAAAAVTNTLRMKRCRRIKAD